VRSRERATTLASESDREIFRNGTLLSLETASEVPWTTP
jgi:hypothetical protein